MSVTLDGTVYIEVEMGSQDKIRQKAESYKRYFQETKEQFDVWFLVKEERQLEKAQYDLQAFPNAYKVDLLANFCSDTSSDTSSD